MSKPSLSCSWNAEPSNGWAGAAHGCGPKRVGGDKGYSSGKIRQYLRRRGIKALISRKKNERPRRRFDRAVYRERNVVERLINRLKRYRRIGTRYEKRAANDVAMWILAAILDWL